MALVRETPVLAAARLMEITDTRLWRIVEHYVKTAVTDFGFSSVQGIGLDETASKHWILRLHGGSRKSWIGCVRPNTTSGPLANLPLYPLGR